MGGRRRLEVLAADASETPQNNFMGANERAVNPPLYYTCWGRGSASKPLPSTCRRPTLYIPYSDYKLFVSFFIKITERKKVE